MAGTIIKGEEHFFTNLYEGNGGGQRVGKFVPFTDQATLSKSVKIDAGSDEGLYRDFTTPTNNKKWTFSGWFKLANLGTNRTLISSNVDGSDYSDVRFNTNNIIYFQNRVGATNLVLSSTDRSFEDTSIWYHVVLIYDSDQGSASDRWKVYVNGDLQSVNNYPGSGDVSSFNKASFRHRLSVSGTTTTSEFTPAFEGDFAGIAQQMFFDGQAYTPDNFGITDTSTGRWIPKTLGSLTYGNNGFRLDFANTAGQTIGDDTSGNGNDFSLYNLTTTDLQTDSPTQNYATSSPFASSYAPNMSQGNLRTQASTASQYSPAYSTLSWDTSDTTGYYVEYYIQDTGNGVGSNFCNFGCVHDDGYNDGLNASYADNPTDGSIIWYENGNMSLGSAGDGNRVNPGAGTIGAYGNTGDIIMMASKGDQIWFGDAKKGVWYSSQGAGQTGNPATGVGGFTLQKKGRWRFTPALGYNSSSGERGEAIANFGQNPTFSGSITAVANTDGSGSLFKYTPPTGYKALMQDNLSETSKGVPDIVWIKNRDAGDNNQWYDSSRGPLNRLKTNSTDGEDIVNDGLQKFLKGGAAIEDDVELNTLGESYVSWNWVVGGGTTSANTDGVGATVACTIQKNTTAGISIVEWTGGGSAGTIEHGLGQVPAWMMYKRKNADGDGWIIYHHKLNSGSPEDGHISLQTTHTFSNDATMWNDTAPTTQLATIGTYGMQNTEKRVGYFFAEIPGFSKFGDFTGNANSDGPFVYLGFKPKFILFKAQTSAHWAIHDSTRDKNQNNQVLYSSLTNAESSNSNRGLDFLSNGFKIRMESGYNLNYSGTQTVYFAFAEHPFNGDGSTAFATAV